MSIIATVKDFGAVGDGETNDTPAIKEAISTVGGMGPGAELFFPLGRYKIQETLRVQTPLRHRKRIGHHPEREDRVGLERSGRPS